jgi:iron complex transport system substrate-binding protein
MPITDPPRRIICLTEEPTEILYALGEGERVVGISAWTVRPPEARAEKPIVSAFLDGNVKRIKALEPDLIIGFSDIQSKLAAELIAEGLQVLIFNQRSIAEILDVILLIGRLVGCEARAQALIAGYEGRIDAARARAARRTHRPRVYFEEWMDPLISAIGWVSELIEIAGGENVFADRAGGSLAKQRFVTADEVIERRPDIILASWCGKSVDRDAILARPGWETLPAIVAGAVHEIPSAIILQPGPASLTDGLDALERILAPFPG